MENKIQELVFSFLDMVSMKHKEVEPGVWMAKVPENEQTFFNGFETLKFTFDRASAEKHRDLELICEGSFLLRRIIERLSEIPKASRLYSTNPPEVAPIGAEGGLRVISDKVYYRPRVVFNFKVQYECDQRREKLYSLVADTAAGIMSLDAGLHEIDLKEFSETAQPDIEIEESGVDILRLYLESCRKLEESLNEEIAELREWGDEQCSENLKVFEAYLDEQKQELLKKKENVSFHLYFFQKEEEIDRLIDNLEEERNRKLTELREKFSLRVKISLINAVVLCIPTIGVIAPKKRRSVAKGLNMAGIASSTGFATRSAIQ
ncbi:MAG: hypothetical protein KKB51_22225 [Candidatus Riflebacteria bacterium]|nr:hypothetical protein [Candidatus Riflebacteria bacterium]